MTEIPLKAWFHEEGERVNQSPRRVQCWLYTGRYPGIQIRHVNRRVILVQTPSPAPIFPIRLKGVRKPRPSRAKPPTVGPAGSMPMQDWLASEAARQGVKPHTIYMRMVRGKYPHVKPITVGDIQRYNFVML